MGDQDIFSTDWINKLKGNIHKDLEFSWIAKHMNCTFLWKIDNQSYVFSIQSGKIKSTHPPTWNDSWDFSIAGPRSTWLNFLKPVPPPCHTDLLAMVSQLPECELNGNRLLAMQHIRSLSRFFTVARETQGGIIYD